MYNGIGLQTPRGSGTNGYVQKNLSYIKPKKDPIVYQDVEESLPKPLSEKKTDPEIVKHEKKRAIEVKCFELQLQLEDEGLDEEEIDEKVDALRSKLSKEFERQL